MNYQASDSDLENFRNTLCQANSKDWEIGKNWYPTYGQLIWDRCQEVDITFEQGCAIFAALSPQCHIDRNVMLFLMATGGCSPFDLPVVINQRHKVHGILEEPNYAYYFLGGRKVQSFFQNLTGDDSYVTVDAHCAPSVKNRKINAVNKRVYEECSQAVIIVAAEFGLQPAEAQAIAWDVERRRKRRKSNENQLYLFDQVA